MTPPTARDEIFGCEPFGHLASPFVDAELASDEHERFSTHLPACEPCRRLVAQYRALDAAARPPLPAVSDARWDAAWLSIRAAIVEDRRRAAASPWSAVGAAWRRLGPARRAPVLQPLAWAAAALALVAVLLTVQRGGREVLPDGGPAPATGPIAAARPAAAAAQMRSVACQAPEYMPIVYTLDGDDPLTVVQCVLVGNET